MGNKKFTCNGLTYLSGAYHKLKKKNFLIFIMTNIKLIKIDLWSLQQKMRWYNDQSVFMGEGLAGVAPSIHAM